MSRSDPGPLRAAGTHLLILGVRCLGGIISRLPPRVWHAIAVPTAGILWFLLGRHRRRTIDNLAAWGRSARESRRIGLACFRSNLLMFFESLAMGKLLERKNGIRIDEHVTPRAQEIIDGLRTGRIHSVQAVSGHFGAWEFVGAELAVRVRPAVTVVSARLPKNPIFANYLKRIRTGFGLELVEKSSFLKYLARHVRAEEPRLYVFLCDQHTKGGVPTDFLGRPACTVAIHGALVERYQSPTLIGSCTREGPGHYRIDIDALDGAKYERLPRERVTPTVLEDVNRFLGDVIRRAPEQWTWGHRRWRDCCRAKGSPVVAESESTLADSTMSSPQ